MIYQKNSVRFTICGNWAATKASAELQVGILRGPYDGKDPKGEILETYAMVIWGIVF